MGVKLIGVVARLSAGFLLVGEGEGENNEW